jgi:NAD-dependent deacetylase
MELKFSESFLNALANSKHAVVSTGAGVSAESGVPTFRGNDGLWKKFKPEELATFEAFQRNPEIVWEWYQHRREIINKIKPNPGHYAIAEMANCFERFDLITQNVDGLHHQAGSKNVIELHGNIRRNRCTKCGKLSFDEVLVQFPPMCDCGGKLRPDVVWYGELLPVEAIEQADKAARNCDLFFVVGTSGIVQPAANLPMIARNHGALVVEINLEPSELTDITHEKFYGKSGEILPVILQKTKELRGIV